jgi:hypothetical protein
VTPREGGPNEFAPTFETDNHQILLFYKIAIYFFVCIPQGKFAIAAP